MGAIAYVLGVASTVVANILTDLITGRSKRARQEDIERQVAIAIARERADNALLREDLARAMAEVSLLITRHPHLSTKGADVVLSNTHLPRVIFPAARRNALLIAELRQLDDIVAARRQELLPEAAPTSMPEPPDLRSRTSDDGDDAQASLSDGPQPAGRWASELSRMGDEIRRRREGE